MGLDKLREEIDEIDKELVALFEIINEELFCIFIHLLLKQLWRNQLL